MLLDLSESHPLFDDVLICRLLLMFSIVELIPESIGLRPSWNIRLACLENAPSIGQGQIRQFAAAKLLDCQFSVTEQKAALPDAEKKRRWTIYSHQPRHLIQSAHCKLGWHPRAKNCIAKLDGPRRVGHDVDH